MLPASRLAATLGRARDPARVDSARANAARADPAHVDTSGAHHGANGPPGLLDTGGEDLSFRAGPGSSPPASTGAVAPRLRWRLGLRAAVLLGVLSLAAGAWFWWRIATAVPEVTPLIAVTETGTADAGTGTTAEEDDAETSDGAGSGSQSGSAGGGADDSGGTAVVHVAGAVKKAGVVALPKGSRVHDAIVAAGGGTAAADLNRLNLAAVLQDGQKIHVPRQGEPAQQESAVDGGGREGSPPAGPRAVGPGTAGSGTAGTGTAGTGTAGSAGADSGPGGASGASGAKVNLNTATVEELDGLPRVGPVLAQRIVDWRAEHGHFKAVEELDAVDGVGPKMLEALLPLVTV